MSKNFGQFTQASSISDTDKVVGHSGTSSGGERGYLWSLIKSTLKTYFDTLYAAVSHTHAQSDVTNLTSDLAAKAPLASPTFTGTPAAPTAAADTNTTQIATTAFAKAEADAAQAHAIQRANHTGTQAQSTITNLESDLAGKAASSHTHAASDIASGTLDGDRLPGLSTTKRGGVPATGTPSGKYLKDDGTWAAIPGGGDMLAANNLSDVASAATAFANIKQSATTTATGVVELATDGETNSGVAVQGNDSRLSNARTPTAHASSHTNGTDDIQSATASQKGLATAAQITKLDGLHAQGSDIASATTVNLDTATGDLVDITGTTTITALTLAQGIQRVVRFTGALTLTHGSSLVLPGGANITTAAGDFAIFRGYASSVVRCVAYVKANGQALVGSPGTANGLLKANGSGVISAATADTDYKSPAAWSSLSGTSPALTFAAGEKRHTLTMSGNTTFTASGYAQGYDIELFITGDSVLRTFTWPSWTWLEGAPADLAASKKMRISLRCTGSSASDVFATYAVQT